MLALAPWPSALGAAWLDATTGEFAVASGAAPVAWERCATTRRPRARASCWCPAARALPAWLPDPAQPEAAIPRTELDGPRLRPARGRRELLAHFGVLTLEAFGCESLAAADRRRRRGRSALRARDAEAGPRPRHGARARARPRTAWCIDALTRRNLELVENLADGSRRGTLLRRARRDPHRRWARACCAQWILRPLAELEPIQDRLDAVEELAFRTVERTLRSASRM